MNPRARFRFSVRRMIVVVAGAALTLAILANYSTWEGYGITTVHLTFHIVDDRNGRPIADSKVVVEDMMLTPMMSIITGADGSASADCQIRCTTHGGGLFLRSRRLSYPSGLRVEALGYQPVDARLWDYTTDPAYQNTLSPPPIVVRMKR